MFGWIGKKQRDALDAAQPLAPADPVEARIARASAAHEADLAIQNAGIARQHPGARLAPQFILWENIWNGPHSELLLTVLELTPFDSFNVRLLAADSVSARALELPIYHHGPFAEVLEEADAHIADLAQRAGFDDIARAARASAHAKLDLTRRIADLAEHYYQTHILPELKAR